MAVKNIGKINLSSNGGIGTLEWKSDYPIASYTLVPTANTSLWDGFKIPPDSGIETLCSGFRFENGQREVLTITDTLITIKIPETKSSLTANVLLNIYDTQNNRYYATIVQSGASKVFTYPLSLRFNSEGGTISNIITSNSGLSNSRVFTGNGKTYYYNAVPSVDWGRISLEKITDDNITWVSQYRLVSTCNLKNDSTTSNKSLSGGITIQPGLVSGSWPTLYHEILPKQPDYYFKLNKHIVSFGANGGTDVTVSMDTNYSGITKSSLPNWITEFSYRNGLGERTISIKTSPNETTIERSASISFKNGDTLLDTLTITQVGKELYFTVEPISIHSPNTGGTYTLTVKTNMQYSMKAFDATTDFGTIWYNVQQSQVNTIREIVYIVKVEPNLSIRQYNGYIMFYPVGKPVIKVPILLEPADPILRYTPISNDVSKDATSLTVYRYCNFPNISESEFLNGITYTKQVITPYPNSVTKYSIDVSENTSSIDRVSYLQSIVYPSNNWPDSSIGTTFSESEQIVAKYTLTQRSSLIFDIRNNENISIRDIHFTNEKSTYNAQVLYNTTWALSNISELPSWLKLVGQTQDLNPSKTNTVLQSYTAEINIGKEREFIAIYKSERAGTIQVRIVQDAGLIPEIKVNPNFKELSAESTEFDITVTSTHDWSASNIPDWIILSSTHGIAGSTIVKATVKPNPLLQRFTSIIFKLNNYNLSDICRIDQTGLENGYDITDIVGDSDWSTRQETRIRDKYVKVKVRYTGDDKVIVTAIKTLYTTSYA